MRVTGRGEDAYELTSEVFFRFWKTAGRYRGECSLKAYLAKIALNVARDQLRSRKRRMAGVRETGLDEASDRRTPCVEGAEPHEWELVRHGLLCLSEEDRNLLTLYYLNDWSYEDLCSTLEIGYDQLRTRLVRARKRLRSQLGLEDER